MKGIKTKERKNISNSEELIKNILKCYIIWRVTQKIKEK